jgi:dTDP-4-dehydrorhamnose 3,5-epimerase
VIRELPIRLHGPRLFELDLLEDDRGSFVEIWHRDRFAALGITDVWVQDNHSVSRRGVLRGMHYQVDPGQAKLVRVGVGRIFDAVVDVRPGSATYGEWEAFALEPAPARVLYIPPGFAHGFCALDGPTHVLYKVSVAYNPAAERGLSWNDPAVGIKWPITDPILSARDRALPPLQET